MVDSIISEINKERPYDTWLEMKLSELKGEYQSLLDDYLRLVRDNSKLRMNINHLRSKVSELARR